MVLQNRKRKTERLEYKGQPVFTFSQVDELHSYCPGTIKKAFYRRLDKLTPGKDYLILPFEAWSKIKGELIRSALNSGDTCDKIFLTRSGYLTLIKRFKDKLARQVQQMLVNADNLFDKLLYCKYQPAAQSHAPAPKAKLIINIRCITDSAGGGSPQERFS